MPCFLFRASQEQRQHPAGPPLQSAHGMAKEAGAAQTDIPRGKSRDAGSVGRPVKKRPVPDWQAGARPHLQQYPPQGCIPGQMPQCTASAIAARCIAQRNALHQPSHRTALPVPQQHLLPGKRQTQPQLPSTARLGQTSKRPLTTAGDPLQHRTLTRPIAPAASTSLPLLSPAVSQPYKIRCAE